MGPAKECVTTHLSKKAVLKMDVAKTIVDLYSSCAQRLAGHK